MTRKLRLRYKVQGLLWTHNRPGTLTHTGADQQAIVIGVDNDATIRIASDAASAKRALHILRRLGHARYMTDNNDITARKIDRALNVADVGTHYLTGTEMRTLESRLRGDTSPM